MLFAKSFVCSENPISVINIDIYYMVNDKERPRTVPCGTPGINLDVNTEIAN